MKKNKILITGATGNIGNSIIEYLLSHFSFDIIATDIEREAAKRCSWFEKVTFIEYNLTSKLKNLFSFFNEPDRVIHLSWFGLPNYQNKFHIEENFINNYFFIKNMLENGLKNITLTGSCFEYGLKNGCLDEDCDTNPVTYYGIAKDTLRKTAYLLSKENGCTFKWIRIFYLYQKGIRNRSIISQLDTAIENGDAVFNLSEGEQLRDYLPFEKVIEYIALISLQDAITGVINCCSGYPISIRKLVENHLKTIQKQIHLNFGHFPYVEYEPMAFWGDNKKLQQCLTLYSKRI